MSAQETRLRNRNEHKCKSSESENAQESSSSTESRSSEGAQESPPSKRKCKSKKVTVVKTKEYKIPRCKKCTGYKVCTFCFKKFPSQKDLNDHTSIGHANYHF